MVTTLNEQIVGQPLMLECAMSSPRGISSRVDVVWSRDGVEVEHINDISSIFSSPEVVVYTNIYTIPLLGTYDDDIVYECEVIINSSPPFKINDNVTLHVSGMDIIYFYILIFKYVTMKLYWFTVPIPTITISPSTVIQGAMVGSPQDIQCIVSTVSGVELSSVMISWMGPGGESITNDSRVTISPTTSSGNNYTSSLQFTYLMEGDEGMYTCDVMILETISSDFINIQNLTGLLILLPGIHWFINQILMPHSCQQEIHFYSNLIYQGF